MGGGGACHCSLLPSSETVDPHANGNIRKQDQGVELPVDLVEPWQRLGHEAQGRESGGGGGEDNSRPLDPADARHKERHRHSES